MFADPYALHVNIGSGSSVVTKDYRLINLAGNASLRRKAVAESHCPQTMRISHSVVGKGVNARDRHLFSLETVGFQDGVERPDIPAKLYLVSDVPRTLDNKSTVTAIHWTYLIGCVRGSSGVAANDADIDEFYTRWLAGES